MTLDGSANGRDAEAFFSQRGGITYNDFTLLPGHIDFSVEDVRLDTRFTRNLHLKRSIVSSPMDTVTESKMAMMGIGLLAAQRTSRMSIWGSGKSPLGVVVCVPCITYLF